MRADAIRALSSGAVARVYLALKGAGHSEALNKLTESSIPSRSTAKQKLFADSTEEPDNKFAHPAMHAAVPHGGTVVGKSLALNGALNLCEPGLPVATYHPMKNRRGSSSICF